MIVTPKYDAALEKAFVEQNEDFDAVVYMAPGTEEQAGSSTCPGTPLRSTSTRQTSTPGCQ